MHIYICAPMSSGFGRWSVHLLDKQRAKGGKDTSALVRHIDTREALAPCVKQTRIKLRIRGRCRSRRDPRIAKCILRKTRNSPADIGEENGDGPSRYIYICLTVGPSWLQQYPNIRGIFRPEPFPFLSLSLSSAFFFSLYRFIYLSWWRKRLSRERETYRYSCRPLREFISN